MTEERPPLPQQMEAFPRATSQPHNQSPVCPHRVASLSPSSKGPTACPHLAMRSMKLTASAGFMSPTPNPMKSFNHTHCSTPSGMMRTAASNTCRCKEGRQCCKGGVRMGAGEIMASNTDWDRTRCSGCPQVFTSCPSPAASNSQRSPPDLHAHPAPYLHHVIDEGLDGAVADEDEVAVQDRPTQVVKSTPASEPQEASARHGHAGGVDTAGREDAAWSYSMVTEPLSRWARRDKNTR